MIFNSKRKALYETELNNRKMYEKRYKEIKKENEELQVKKGYAELNQKVQKLMNDNFDLGCENRNLKEELAKVKIELEDTKGFLEQEKECSSALRKEKTNLKRKVTNLEKEMGKNEIN